MTDQTDSDNSADVPDGWDEDAIEMMADTAKTEQPDSVDPNQDSRQDEGWVRFYVECPDCNVPMHQTTMEGEEIADQPEFVHSATETRYRMVCPECGRMVTHIQVRRVTATADDIKDAYSAIVSMKDKLVNAMQTVVSD